MRHADVGRQIDSAALACNLGAIRNGGANIVWRELRIRFQDLLRRLAAGEKVENQRHPDARTPDARLAEADVGVDHDAVER